MSKQKDSICLFIGQITLHLYKNRSTEQPNENIVVLVLICTCMLELFTLSSLSSNSSTWLLLLKLSWALNHKTIQTHHKLKS